MTPCAHQASVVPHIQVDFAGSNRCNTVVGKWPHSELKCNLSKRAKQETRFVIAMFHAQLTSATERFIEALLTVKKGLFPYVHCGLNEPSGQEWRWACMNLQC